INVAALPQHVAELVNEAPRLRHSVPPEELRPKDDSIGPGGGDVGWVRGGRVEAEIDALVPGRDLGHPAPQFEEAGPDLRDPSLGRLTEHRLKIASHSGLVLLLEPSERLQAALELPLSGPAGALDLLRLVLAGMRQRVGGEAKLGWDRRGLRGLRSGRSLRGRGIAGLRRGSLCGARVHAHSVASRRTRGYLSDGAARPAAGLRVS